MEEIWKDIKGYENLYMISSYGRVKSVDKYDRLGRFWKGKILKNNKQSNGYFSVGLSKNGKMKYFLIHRLVAEAFIPNPENYPCVNHKDENPSNNFVSNLEFCTYGYNNNYGTRNQRLSESLKSHSVSEQSKKKMSQIKNKTVFQFTRDGKFVKQWKSVNEAEETLGIWHISSCATGKRETAGGFKWSYK